MSRTPYRFPRDLKYLVDPLRNWSYLPLTPNFYCPFCNNLDPHRPPVDEKGTPRILEADSLGLAPRRPVVKDFTGRRELLGEDFTARQPTRWQYLGTRRLSFDIPYEDLLVGGRDGCPSCALLFDAGERFEAPGYVKERYLGRNTNIIGDGEPIDGVDMGGPEDVAGLYVDIFRFEWNDHLSMRVRTFSGIDIDFFTLPGSKSPWPAIGPEIVVTPNSDSESSLQLVKMWERECVKNHPKCKSRCANTRLPKRVLDVSLSIRLVETLEPPGTYVALSHCWGKKRIITTTTDTLEERKTGIPFESLSKTFQDAVAMTRRLGYRYLWIDSMCIIQDDSSDWQQESSKMARIYTDAHVVISASASADGDGGCFSIRGQGLHRRTAHFQGPAFGEAREPWTVYVREAPSHSIQSTSRQQDPQLPLFSRAWAYQERLLATRILHFAKDELVWECRSSMTCECRRLDGDIGFKVRYHNAQEAEGEQSTESRKHLSVEEMYRRASRKDRKDLLRSFRNKQHEAVEADPWQLIVTNFSKRLLTKQLDRLPALSGLVKATEHSGTGKYVAGLWSKTMIDNIVWQNSNAQRTSPFYGYIAPSWSWAALPNCIPQFYPPSDILDATILNISCTPSGADPTGALSSGHMDIRGPLQKATLFYQDSDFDPNNRFPKHINRRFYISLDSLRDSSTYSVPPDLDISNYKGVFGTKAGALRTLKVRNYRTLLDISDTSFLDDSLPSYLPPASSVYCLLIGRVKAISCREEPIYNPFGGGWTISKDDEYLRALVLRESVKVLGAFERIGILDPDPTRDNPHPFYANDGKHPMLDHSRRLFGEAKETIVRVV